VTDDSPFPMYVLLKGSSSQRATRDLDVVNRSKTGRVSNAIPSYMSNFVPCAGREAPASPIKTMGDLALIRLCGDPSKGVVQLPLRWQGSGGCAGGRHFPDDLYDLR